MYQPLEQNDSYEHPYSKDFYSTRIPNHDIKIKRDRIERLHDLFKAGGTISEVINIGEAVVMTKPLFPYKNACTYTLKSNGHQENFVLYVD